MVLEELKTKEEYEAALAEIQQLWDAVPTTPEGKKLEGLIKLVEQYEQKIFEAV